MMRAVRSSITALLLASATQTWCQADARLLDDQLAWSIASVSSIEGDEVVLADGSRRRDILAVEFSRGNSLVAAGPSASDFTPSAGLSSGSTSLVRLVDGTVLTGSPDAPSLCDDEEQLSWVSPEVGHVCLPLESVAWVSLGTPPGELESAGERFADDRVWFRNGDFLSGFLVSMGDEIAFEAEASHLIETPVDQVAGVWLANERTTSDRPVVVLDSGASLPMLSLISSGPSEWVLSSAVKGTQSTEAAPSSPPRSVILRPNRLRPLSSLPLASTERGGTGLVPREARRGPWRPGLDAGTLSLGGPMSVTFEIPEGSELFACQARVPWHRAPWGACDLVVAAGSIELARFPLDAAADARDIRVDLPPDAESLVLTVEGGRFGPIRDAVEIAGAMLLVAPDGPGS